MKKIILVCLLLTCYFTTNGQSYPIETIFKGDSVVIMTTKQSNDINELVENLRSAISKLETEKANLQNVIVNKNKILESKTNLLDSLKIKVDSLKERNDILINFKRDILNLAWYGSILYKRGDKSYRYIPLSGYEWSIDKNDVITLIPIKDKSKWKVFKFDESIDPYDLELHFWPYESTENKLKIQR